MYLPDIQNSSVAVIGLGYVGLPLLTTIAKYYPHSNSSASNTYHFFGYDINNTRISQLYENYDSTGEVPSHELDSLSGKICYTNDKAKIINCDFYIVTVPTPVDEFNKPDFTPLLSACKILSELLKARTSTISPILIFESTVYPGATEEVCINEIEKLSSLRANKDFAYGYSPERVNPGDRNHTIDKIVKVTSGSNEQVAEIIDSFYASFISAGTFKAKSVIVAEAAKVIENTQRDINIALVNELAIIASKLSISSLDVLEAAQTKWNFLNFVPGLVGGHCIGVDPYYLTYKAESLGYHPQLVLAGRRINDNMHVWIANQIILHLSRRKINLCTAKILVLGLTFKENCPDFRNSKSLLLINELHQFTDKIFCIDPYFESSSLPNLPDLTFSNTIDNSINYDCILGLVPHKMFKSMGKTSYEGLSSDRGFFYDIKNVFPLDLDNVIKI